MSFKRYGKVQPTSEELQKDLYYLLQILKELNKNNENKVLFELIDEKSGNWDITFKRKSG